MIKGQVISGDFGKLLIRQKNTEQIELGELLVAENDNGKVLMQVYDLIYGSQISQQNLELMSGLKLEENSELEIFQPELRAYNICAAKPMLFISDNGARLCKSLPKFFSEVKEVRKEDLSFLTKPMNSIFLGNLRSGSKVMDVQIFFDGKDVLSHHVLIPATTGRGKSNLCSVLLWDQVGKDYCGVLVLDPHDEYYGRNALGLKDHPNNERVVYYTPFKAPPGARTLKINISALKPGHFNGVVDWTDPQRQMLTAYFRKYGQRWVEAIVIEKPLDVQFNELTFAVVRRRILSLLGMEYREKLYCSGIFDVQAGESTIIDICNELEKGNTVIVDTSSFSGAVEILVGSMIVSEAYARYKRYKVDGTLDTKPVISVVLEEAPRVLGKEVLEKGSNIFSTIAREGRKFKVGLMAITQLPSLIPREILANMNTKIILGIEMGSERNAIIESASQDLSTDSRNIAALDKGEAIITSNFARFAMPVKIPLFSEFAKVKAQDVKRDFSGVKP